MAFHRATLIAMSLALATAAAAAAQTSDTSTTTTTSDTTTSTSQTMQPVSGNNLLWLSSGVTTCPSGYKLTTVQTSSGPKKACLATSTTSTTTSTAPQ